jgi:NAD(P)-dependent dehydrogenase (short-subunit alcohol dehydrogenase family)
MSVALHTSGLEGKVALVTGAASGIGRAAALGFVSAGARVAVADIDGAAAAALVTRITDAGGDAIAIEVDVASEASVAEMVKTTIAELDGLDAAFNCAGILPRPARLLDVTQPQWDRVLAVNLTGTLHCLRHEILWMREHGGGAIVNAGSRASLGAIQDEVDYVVSKHGVLALTRVAALEHAGDGIRVNAIAPFFINTPMLAQVNGAILEGARGANPSGRFGEPHEVAAAVVWLCSPQASYISGVALPIDGGFDAL